MSDCVSRTRSPNSLIALRAVLGISIVRNVAGTDGKVLLPPPFLLLVRFLYTHQAPHAIKPMTIHPPSVIPCPPPCHGGISAIHYWTSHENTYATHPQNRDSHRRSDQPFRTYGSTRTSAHHTDFHPKTHAIRRIRHSSLPYISPPSFSHICGISTHIILHLWYSVNIKMKAGEAHALHPSA